MTPRFQAVWVDIFLRLVSKIVMPLPANSDDFLKVALNKSDHAIAKNLPNLESPSIGPLSFDCLHCSSCIVTMRTRLPTL